MKLLIRPAFNLHISILKLPSVCHLQTNDAHRDEIPGDGATTATPNECLTRDMMGDADDGERSQETDE